MEGHCLKYCRFCGSDVLVSDEFCPKCGGNQPLRSKEPVPGRLVLLVAAGLIGIILLGIASAVALPRLASGRTRKCNAVTYRNMVSANRPWTAIFSATASTPIPWNNRASRQTREFR